MIKMEFYIPTLRLYAAVLFAGAVSVIARITTKNSRTVKLVIGPDGQRIRKIAQDVEQCLRKFYLKDVMVRLIVEEGRINLDKK